MKKSHKIPRKVMKSHKIFIFVFPEKFLIHIIILVKVRLLQKTVKFDHSAAFQKVKFQNFLQPW